MPTPRQTLTPPELAARWGVGHEKILAWIHAGELRALNLATRRDGQPRWAIQLAEVERFEASRSSAPAPKPAKRRAVVAAKDYFA